MVTDGNHTFCGEHCIMYVMLNCYAVQLKLILYVNYTSIKNLRDSKKNKISLSFISILPDITTPIFAFSSSLSGCHWIGLTLVVVVVTIIIIIK